MTFALRDGEKEHLGQSTVVLLWLNDLTAVVLQVEQDDHLAHSIVLYSALCDSLLEVAIPPQDLQHGKEGTLA